ncbi:MAG: glycosyltransferase [Alloprevotella sp.]|nr:glycosyltransferase [Alloprevotella sp.]
MRILHFITSIDKSAGGPSRSVPLLAKGQALAGLDITLMVVRSDNMNVKLLEDANISVHFLERGYSKKEVTHFIETGGFDLIQIQSLWDLRYHQVARIAQRLHIPYIITPRGMLDPWCLRRKALKKQLALAIYQKADLNKARCIYAATEIEARHIGAMGINTPRAVVPNGLETDSYPCRVEKKQVKKQVLFLSRVHMQKGVELLIEAWKNIAQEFADWQLLIVGNGTSDYIQHLNEIVKEAGLADKICILPPAYDQDKIRLYQESAVFVLPSYSESFGMAVAEAMSCGVPVITTDGTPWEMLNKTATGWCIPLSVQSLENTLREALSKSSDELFEMGQRAANLVRRQFDFREVAGRTVELYRWILEGGEEPDFVIK